jgi:phage-related protein
MAAGSNRALTLKLLADVDNFTKNINKADNDVTGFGDKVTKFGKIAGAAFLAAGVAAAAYAGKLAIDGVKAAIEDEAAQAKLATTLRNVTGATDSQIKATEAYILKQSLLFGVTDDELRPSLDRLTRATGDVTKAQQLQSVAINIAAGTGKSLQAVTEALSKAQEGNLAGLSRLGVGISKAELATMTFDQVTAKLAATFEGQATIQADTFQGKMARLSIAFDEAKETVGSFILDAITPLVENIVTYIVPAVQAFASGIGGEGGLKAVFMDIISVAKTILIPIFQGVQSVFNKVKDAVMENRSAFSALWSFTKNVLAPFMGGAFKVAFEVIGTVIGTTVNAVGKLISAFQTLFEWGSKVAGFLGFGGSSNSSSTNMSAPPPPSNSKSPFVPIIPNAKGLMAGGSAVTNNITVNGAIDSESAARQIVQVLNQSSYRGSLGAGALVAV